ncbi:MAG: prolipoprotein diacylglyceryl transferase [Bacteriovoracia bacterium]
MYPILFSIGSFSVHTYGVFAAIGFLAGVAVVKYMSRELKLDVETMVDFTFWNMLLGFVGARILFVFTRLEYFMGDPLAIFRIWEGGLVFYGGLILDIAFSFWYTKKKNISMWTALDVMTPALAIAHMFGRFGCFSAGCCYGRPTDSIFGVRFNSELVDVSLRGVPLHPTQLYEAFALFVVFLGLMWVFKRRRFVGQVGLTYMIVYPIVRICVEYFRGDQIRGFVIQDYLSTSQFISVILVSIAIVVFIRRAGSAMRASGRPA